jgi:hypothetical protein
MNAQEIMNLLKQVLAFGGAYLTARATVIRFGNCGREMAKNGAGVTTRNQWFEDGRVADRSKKKGKENR